MLCDTSAKLVEQLGSSHFVLVDCRHSAIRFGSGAGAAAVLRAGAIRRFSKARPNEGNGLTARAPKTKSPLRRRPLSAMARGARMEICARLFRRLPQVEIVNDAGLPSFDASVACWRGHIKYKYINISAISDGLVQATSALEGRS
jgi:hypothetical protein